MKPSHAKTHHTMQWYLMRASYCDWNVTTRPVRILKTETPLNPPIPYGNWIWTLGGLTWQRMHRMCVFVRDAAKPSALSSFPSSLPLSFSSFFCVLLEASVLLVTKHLTPAGSGVPLPTCVFCDLWSCNQTLLLVHCNAVSLPRSH